MTQTSGIQPQEWKFRWFLGWVLTPEETVRGVYVVDPHGQNRGPVGLESRSGFFLPCPYQERKSIQMKSPDSSIPRPLGKYRYSPNNYFLSHFWYISCTPHDTTLSLLRRVECTGHPPEPPTQRHTTAEDPSVQVRATYSKIQVHRRSVHLRARSTN